MLDTLDNPIEFLTKMKQKELFDVHKTFFQKQD